MPIVYDMLRLASENVELRPTLIRLVAREFGTEEALKKYLKEHPKADKSKHTVKKDKGDKDDSYETSAFSEKHGVHLRGISESQLDDFYESPEGKEIREYNIDVIAGEDHVVDAEALNRAVQVREKYLAVQRAAAKDKDQRTKEDDDALDVCQTTPACGGNLGVSRSSMPQFLQISPKAAREAIPDSRFEELLDMETSGKGLPKDIDGEEREAYYNRKNAEAAIAAGADPESDVSVFDAWVQNLEGDGVKVTKPKGGMRVGDLRATQSEISADAVLRNADKHLRGQKLTGGVIYVSSDGHILDGHHRWAGLLTADPDAKIPVVQIGLPMKELLAKSFDQPGVFRQNFRFETVDPDEPIDLAYEDGETWKQPNGKWYGKKDGKAGGPYDSEKAAKEYASSKGGKKALLIPAVLRLARRDSEIRPHVLRLVAREFDTKEQLEKYLKDHPNADKTKHTVKDDSSDGGGEDDSGGGVSGWLSRVKGLADKGKKALSDLSDKAQKALTDPETRKEALSAAGKAIKEAPAKMGKKLVHHFAEEIAHTGDGIRKVMGGELPSKKEAEAMFSLAVEVAAAATVLSTGGAMGAAGFFGKSVTKHVALSAINPMLGRLHILQEMGHVGHVIGHMVEFGAAAAHHAAEEKDPKDLTDEELANVFVNAVMSAVAAQLEGGMSDEDVVKALNADHPDLDLEKLEFGKKAASVSVQYSREGMKHRPLGAIMHSDNSARTKLIRLASKYPKGSDERRSILRLLSASDFDPSEIGEVEPGALEEGTPEEKYQGDHFTQQEFSELGEKQEKGELGEKVDDGEKKMSPGQQDEARLAAQERVLFDRLVRLASKDKKARGPILTMLRKAGYITPEGKVAADKFAGGKKATVLPSQDRRVREQLIRLAHARPEFRSKILPVIAAYDREHK